MIWKFKISKEISIQLYCGLSFFQHFFVFVHNLETLWVSCFTIIIAKGHHKLSDSLLSQNKKIYPIGRQFESISKSISYVYSLEALKLINKKKGKHYYNSIPLKTNETCSHNMYCMHIHKIWYTITLSYDFKVQ